MPVDPMKSQTPVAKLDDAAREQIAKAEKSAAEAQTQLAALKKQAEETETKRVALEKQVLEERNVRLTKEFISKAEKLTHIVAIQKADELGPILKALHDVAPEQAAKIEKLLEQTNEKLKRVDELLKEHGHNRDAGGETSAFAQLQKAASELRKADPKLTEPAAITKAMELHPELYEQYYREAQGRA